MKHAVKSLIEKLRPSADKVEGPQDRRMKVQASLKPDSDCLGNNCKAVMDNMLADLRDFDKRIDQKLNDVCLAERQGA